MKKSLLLLSLLGLTAGSWIQVVIDQNGKAVSTNYNETNVAHVLGTNEYLTTYPFPTNAFCYWKNVGSDWVAMSTNEMATVDAAVISNKSNFASWKTQGVTGDTLADALKALVICVNRRIPATNAITVSEFTTELKNQLSQ